MLEAEQVAERLLRSVAGHQYRHSQVFYDLVEMAKERLRAGYSQFEIDPCR